MPLRVRVPLPSLVSPPSPRRFPAKVLLILLPPRLRVLPVPINAVPLPVRLARLAEAPRLSAAPTERVTVALLPSAPLLSVVRLPASASNVPLYVLLPLSVTSARPYLVSVPAPAMMPPRVRLLLPASARLALTLRLLASTSGAVLSRVEAPATLSAPLPSEPPVPSVSVPAFTVVPPV